MYFILMSTLSWFISDHKLLVGRRTLSRDSGYTSEPFTDLLPLRITKTYRLGWLVSSGPCAFSILVPCF